MPQKRILIVEDSLYLANVMAQILSTTPYNYRVEHCTSAEAAQEWLCKTAFDLVISDLHLPEMSGLDLLRYVHQHYPQTRSILVTAFGSPQVEYQTKALTATYLPKPFSLQELTGAVQQTLQAP